MSDITINYKGSAIATMDASGTKTLLTEGKYCEDDLEVVYVKPSGGGLPAVLDKVDAGTATLATSSDIIQVSHNLGRVPDFACIYQDLSDWADVALGVCVLATYIRFRYPNANETYNSYIYAWRYKHGTSGNSLGASSAMISSNATATTFKFVRGNVNWATVDANGNPVTYKWMVGTFKEAT